LSSCLLALGKPASGLHEITPEIAALATQFPDDFSPDPADRLIAGTARSLGLQLVNGLS
jgi:PIN domain nuclease of toxin-antitoxin system